MTRPIALPGPRLTPIAAAPIADRGRMMLPAEVARELFSDQVKGRWILDNAPAALRVLLGRKICFREHDMIAWRDSLGGAR